MSRVKCACFLAILAALAACGKGSSKPAPVLPPPPTAPAAPSDLTATSIASTRIDLAWTVNSTDEFGFRIERAPDSAGTPGPWAEIATVPAASVDYSDTGLDSPSTHYWYRVRAYNDVGNSLYSNEASAVTRARGSPVMAGSTTSFATDMATSTWGWGDNASGQLGVGDGVVVGNTPVKLNLGEVKTIAGAGFHHLALMTDGTVWAWGMNGYGQLGIGVTSGREYVPAQVVDPSDPTGFLTGVTAVAGGRYHSLAVKDDGTVWGWGRNVYGQLCMNSGGPVPARLTAIPRPAVSVSAGSDHSIVLDNVGQMWAFGTNTNGELGVGSFTNTAANYSPRAAGFSGMTMIASAGGHNLAANSTYVYAWGYNANGELGDGTTTNRSTPVMVRTDTGVLYGTTTAIACGYGHGMALKDGTVWTWGSNTYGQLGNGTLNSSVYASLVIDAANPTGYLTSVEGIAGGSYHNLALKVDGTVWAWGWNGGGQLGNASIVDNSTAPLQVLNLPN